MVKKFIVKDVIVSVVIAEKSIVSVFRWERDALICVSALIAKIR